MSEQAIELSQALEVISTLEQQLEALETTSREYENELEVVIEKLKQELLSKNDEIQKLKDQVTHPPREDQVTSLEILVDELEIENNSLKAQVGALQQDNDRSLEQNVMLKHEINDLREALQRIPKDDKIEKNLHHSSSMRVTTKGPTLRVTSMTKQNGDKKTHLSSATVMATTAKR